MKLKTLNLSNVSFQWGNNLFFDFISCVGSILGIIFTIIPFFFSLFIVSFFISWFAITTKSDIFVFVFFIDSNNAKTPGKYESVLSIVVHAFFNIFRLPILFYFSYCIIFYSFFYFSSLSAFTIFSSRFFCCVAVKSSDVLIKTVPTTLCEPDERIPPSNPAK